MKKLFLSVVTVATLAVAVPAFAQNVAIVNGKPIPKARMDALSAQMAAAGRPVPAEMQDQLKEELIIREIFLQEAQKAGLDATDDYKNQMELARQQVLIGALFRDWAEKNPIADAEAKAEYDRIVAANSGKEYKARHILVDKEDQAKAIIASLKKGAKFDDIAKKQSKDAGSGARGGDLDWAPANAYVQEFTEALVKLNKGQLTQTPVKSQFGWHVIRLDDVRETQMPSFEDVKPQLTRQLQQQRLAQYQKDLREKAKIE